MLSSDIEILVIPDAEINSANDFFNAIYKSGRNEKKFRWEFRESPALPGVYVIAKDKNTGKIVGCQAAIPVNLFNDKGETILTAKSEDTLVHPDYRGLSIFENMYKLLFSECEKRGIQYIWGFTYAKKPFAKLGFDTPYVVGQSLIAFDIFGAAAYLSKYNRTKTFVSKVKMIGLCVFSKMVSVKRTMRGDKELNGITSSVMERPSMTDNMLLSTNVLSTSTGYFMIRQDLDYLRWRIADNPYHDEILDVDFFVDSKKVASVIFNHHEEGVWYLIQDLYDGSLTQSQKTAILNKAFIILHDTRRSKLKLLRTWDFSHNAVNLEELILRKKVGFTSIKHGAIFVWKRLGGSAVLDPKGFILSRIASEGKI